MLTPKVQTSLKHATAYFREHLGAAEYYSAHAQVRGEWFGIAADRLGLKGTVTEKEFLRLCDGLHPRTGTKLTARRNSCRRENGQSVANRRVFYDFTFSPPKSVSVVAFLHDVRVISLHDNAVRIAMTELERYAQTRVRRQGQNAERLTGNLLGAAFRHDTSRELDPHLHTHAVVFNATFDPAENRWKALQAFAMYRAQKLAERVYFHELTKGLHRLGYATEVRGHNFEIKGVPQSVIECFSKRHRQIEAEAARRVARGEVRGNLKDVREQIARDLRKRKAGGATAERQRSTWQRELTVAERENLRGVRGAPVQPEPIAAADLIAWADAHLFERHAVVTDAELLATALQQGRGREVSVAALREAARRDYLQDADGLRITSQSALRCELEVVLAARDGRGAHRALAPDFVPTAKLSAEQDRAVRHILASRDLITLFRGGAGTGKSFALREVHRGLTTAGHAVVVVAPQRQQAHDLTRDGLPADTLARLLTAQSLPRGAVVLVDEAGQLGGRQLHAVLQLARANDARLILSGDTRQHGAVVASDALRAIEAYSGLVPAEVTTIRRQDPMRASSTVERTRIARYRAAVKAASAGDLESSFAILDRLGWVREETDRHAAVAREYRAATDRGESALVVAPTWSEVHAVNAAIRAELAQAGRLGPAAELTTYVGFDATLAEKRDPTFYHAGQSVHFVQRYGRFAKGDIFPVIGASAKGVTVLKDGRRSTVSLRYADRLSVVEPRPLTVGAGDRLQLKFNGKSAEGAPLLNGELVTIRHVRADGRIVVATDAGATRTLLPTQRLFNLGYAITSYGAQGKTVDTVLLSDSGERAATNRNQWYVAISRARKRALVLTVDKAALREHIRREGGRTLALDLDPVRPTSPTPVPRWVRRAREAIATLHRFRAVQRVHTPAAAVRRRV